MARHLFRKIGDQPWEDLGSESLVNLGEALTEEEFVCVAMRIAEVTDGPEIRFKVLDVPDDAVNTAPSGV